MGFKQFNLSPELLTQLAELGFHTPTPIQKEAIPVISAGQDVLGLAQTGTGKTAAFVLPLLQRLQSGQRGQIRALILAPTRELAEQINNDIRSLGQATGVRSLAIYGGVSFFRQQAVLRRGVEIIVACPGRLLDHLQQGTIRLGSLECLVLDEADQMFDMGFLPSIKQILAKIPAQRQSLLFSATMPDAIQKLAHEILKNPVKISIAYTEPLTNIDQAFYEVAPADKTAMLCALLKETAANSIIIFTRTKDRSERLAKQLAKADFAAVSFQGNLSQSRRRAILDGFRNSEFQILVATDIAARGIDISLISHVINYDLPDTLEAYTHRIGRTGRAGRQGHAYTLVGKRDRGFVRALERKLNLSLAYRTIAYTPMAPEAALSERSATSTTADTAGARRFAAPADTTHRPRKSFGSGNKFGRTGSKFKSRRPRREFGETPRTEWSERPSRPAAKDKDHQSRTSD
ncbi:MAG TPA: DEAD/DEAH box helicase, partial [Candidatus Babeliales bacterium]|nr:DEAD/DEAH box helicase [Candidatus Babeliales bacterium]